MSHAHFTFMEILLIPHLFPCWKKDYEVKLLIHDPLPLPGSQRVQTDSHAPQRVALLFHFTVTYVILIYAKNGEMRSV